MISNPIAAQYTGKRLRENKSFILRLLKKELSVIHLISKKLKNDKSFIEKAIEIEPSLVTIFG